MCFTALYRSAQLWIHSFNIQITWYNVILLNRKYLKWSYFLLNFVYLKDNKKNKKTTRTHTNTHILFLNLYDDDKFLCVLLSFTDFMSAFNTLTCTFVCKYVYLISCMYLHMYVFHYITKIHIFCFEKSCSLQFEIYI